MFYYKDPPISLQILSVQTLKVQLGFPEFILMIFRLSRCGMGHMNLHLQEPPGDSEADGLRTTI